MFTSLISICISCLLLAACGAGKNAPTDGQIPDGPLIDGPLTDGPLADAPPVDAPPPDSIAPDCVPAAGTEVSTDLVASGLIHPVYATSPANDRRLFIVEQPGRIRIVKDGALLEQSFLDIGGAVLSVGDEQGLLGVAFHPNYATNGRFFVNYTALSPERDTVIAEYQASADPDTAAATEKRLLVINQPYGNHNGGMLAFGPDGFLYIGMGDGGAAGDIDENGEDNTTLLGAMLRIDIDSGDPYGIPPGNPYANSPNGPADPRPEIWAIGLRNPWRYSFDRQTGDLYIADVGQDEWEEVNVQPAASPGGEDYGWDIMEGTHCYEPSSNCDMSGKVLPVVEYSHAGDACAITGGYVYRGTCMPDLKGRYFYADHCSNQVWTFEYVNGEATNVQELARSSLGQEITSFGEDATGELYAVSHGGDVYRLVIANN